MLVIEFFGPSGSGKTFLRNKMIKKIDSKIYNYDSLYNKFNTSNIFTKIFFSIIKSNLVKKIKNLIIIKKKIKTINFFYKDFSKSKILNSNLDKFKINLEYIYKLIDKSYSTKTNKIVFKSWAKRELATSIFARGLKDGSSLIDSEGLLQRLFIYCNKQNSKKKIIKQYIKHICIPDIVVVFEKKINNKKKILSITSKEEKKIIRLTLKELKKMKILIINSKIGFDKVFKKINTRFSI